MIQPHSFRRHIFQGIKIPFLSSGGMFLCCSFPRRGFHRRGICRRQSGQDLLELLLFGWLTNMSSNPIPGEDHATCTYLHDLPVTLSRSAEPVALIRVVVALIQRVLIIHLAYAVPLVVLKAAHICPIRVLVRPMAVHLPSFVTLTIVGVHRRIDIWDAVGSGRWGRESSVLENHCGLVGLAEVASGCNRDTVSSRCRRRRFLV